VLAVIGFALSGLGVANVVPVLFALSAARRPDAIEQATSSVFATGYLGFLLGPSLIGFLANEFGLSIALGVIAVSLGLIVVGTPGRK
jgi:MFS family permease